MPKKRRKTDLETEKDLNDENFLQQEIFKYIQMDNHYVEHTMSLDQLADIYPLARLDYKNPSKSRGMNDDEAESTLSQANNLQNKTKNWAFRGMAAFNCLSNSKKTKKYSPKIGYGSNYDLNRFFRQFLNTFRLLLLMAAIICFVIFLLDRQHKNELVMAIVLFSILLIMCFVSYYEQTKTLKQISGFRNMLPVECTVIRQGKQRRVSASTLVVGDLIYLRMGDRLPADLRLIYSDALRIETSFFSGDVEPLEYTHDIAKKGMDVFEAQNVAFGGSSCTSGEGIGIVIRVKTYTLIGKLIELIASEKHERSCLEKEHKKFVRFITIVSLIMATCTFIFGLYMKGFANFYYTFVNGFLIVMVANVPQGLPVTLTAQLLIVVRRLWRKCGGMALKQPDLADTLGMTSVLMTDKSGALTSNSLQVTDLWCSGKFVDLDEYLPEKNGGKKLPNDEKNSVIKSNKDMSTIFIDVLEVMSVCNSAYIDSIEDPQLTILSYSSIIKKMPSFRRLSCTKTAPAPEIQPTKIVIQPEMNGKTSPRKMEPPSLMYALKHKDLHQNSTIGRPTDVALLRFVEKFSHRNFLAQNIRQKYEIVHEVPFSAYRRYHLVIVVEKTILEVAKSSERNSESEELLRYKILVKGAPEELIRNCATIVVENGVLEELTDENMVKFEEAFLKLGEEGKSCLAFASFEFDDFSDILFTSGFRNSELSDLRSAVEHSRFPESGWCFLGMVGMLDPPRPNIRDVVGRIERAGIRLFMVTGDHPTTAEALARQIGFGDNNGDLWDLPKHKFNQATSTKNDKNLPFSVENEISSEQRIIQKQISVDLSAGSSGYSSAESIKQPNQINTLSGPSLTTIDSSSASSMISFTESAGIWPRCGVRGNSTRSSSKVDSVTAIDEENVHGVGESEDSLLVIHGDSLADYTENEIRQILRRRHCVFARTTPAQKIQLVKQCQKNKHVVTLAGDGLMDALALKQADIGIAMEAGGSIFAKEASDIIITDNSLGNLFRGVEEARLLFDNLKKTIAYTLSHLLPELLPVLLSFVLGFPLGLTSLQVLTIDLLTEIPPSIALIFEPAERDIMKQAPRRRHARLVTPTLLAYAYCFAGTIISLGCVFAYFTVFWINGLSVQDLLFTSNDYWQVGAPSLAISSGGLLTAANQMQIRQEANAAWHITLVVSQIFHLWTCTTRRTSLFRHGIRNWTLMAAVLFESVILFLLIYAPILQNLIEIQPPPAIIWLYPFGVGFVLLIFNELRKYFIRTKPKNRIVRLFKW